MLTRGRQRVCDKGGAHVHGAVDDHVGAKPFQLAVHAVLR
jgi:hypothetical protein